MITVLTLHVLTASLIVKAATVLLFKHAGFVAIGALADPSIDALNATTLKEIWPRKIIDQFFKATPFAAYLRAKRLSPYRGGAFMQNTHLGKPMIGGAYAPGQNWNMTKRQTITATFFDPKYYEVGVPEYLEQILVENVGELAAFSLVDIDMTNAMNTISGIVAVDLALHGQASGSGIVGNRPNNLNGWIEAVNDGITPGWDGSIFTSYGNQPRNGFFGNVFNSIPVFVGNSTTGATAPAQYNVFEENYQTATVGDKESDLGVCNKALYAYIKERIQPQQRFAQERDPYWGASGMKMNAAMILKDDYFPSNKYGVNDPDLGNFQATTFSSPGTTANGGTADPTSNLPASGTTVNVGEVFAWFRMADFLFRIADNPIFGFGFSGFVPTNDNSRVFGTVKAMCQLQCLSPRTQHESYGYGG